MDIRVRMAEDRARAQLVVALAAGAVGMPIDQVMGGGRETRVAFARQVAMYVMHVAFGVSLGRVAMAFGRDRSTIAHACRRIEDMRDDKRFDRWIEALEAAAAGTPVTA
jgi:chromosomal replication initiation ATPase DnaA